MLAVSAALALVFLTDDQVPTSRPILREPLPTTVMVYADRRPVGRGYMLDSEGYFIVPRILGRPQRIESDGPTATEFELVTTDGLSGLSLIRSLKPWTGVTAVLKPPSDRQDGDVLRGIAVVGADNRVLTAEIVGKTRAGLLESPNRLVPVNEIRYQQTANPTGVIFMRQGELHGIVASVLNATVNLSSGNQSQRVNPDNAQAAADSLQNSTTRLEITNSQFQSYGPAGLIVGHLLGSDIIRRVYEGFKSPSRRVIYPFFGVVCRNSMSGGAEVVEVSPKSPAEQAGLRPGDVLRQVGRFVITNQFDYAAVIWKFKPGERVSVGYQRERTRSNVEVAVGGISY